jgi:hypothetical protein
VVLKNITFSASPDSIDRARRRATLEHTTLNDKFREWLDTYALRKPTLDEFQSLMDSLKHVDAGRKFTREEMNERKRRS